MLYKVGDEVLVTIDIPRGEGTPGYSPSARYIPVGKHTVVWVNDYPHGPEEYQTICLRGYRYPIDARLVSPVDSSTIAMDILKPYIETPFRHTQIVSVENALKAMEEYLEYHNSNKKKPKEGKLPDETEVHNRVSYGIMNAHNCTWIEDTIPKYPRASTSDVYKVVKLWPTAAEAEVDLMEHIGADTTKLYVILPIYHVVKINRTVEQKPPEFPPFRVG